MKTLHRFFLGMREFRRAYTTYFPDADMRAYDKGREFAHVITFRYFEDARSEAFPFQVSSHLRTRLPRT